MFCFYSHLNALYLYVHIYIYIKREREGEKLEILHKYVPFDLGNGEEGMWRSGGEILKKK